MYMSCIEKTKQKTKPVICASDLCPFTYCKMLRCCVYIFFHVKCRTYDVCARKNPCFFLPPSETISYYLRDTIVVTLMIEVY